MAICKKCGAPIVWIATPANRWMPCNEGLVEYHAGSTPDFEDTVINDKGEVIQCTFDFQCDPDGMAHIPHWVTCPFSGEMRRKNRTVQETIWT